MQSVNRTVQDLPPYDSKEVAVGPHTVDTLRMNLGEPWFGKALPILTTLPAQLTSETLAELLSAYNSGQGSPELIEAIGAFYQCQHSLRLQSEELLVTHGAAEALVLAILTATESEDEVLVLDPSYVLYSRVARLLGRRPVRHARIAASQWTLDLERLANDVSPRTRALIINSPDNPTGSTLDLSTLGRLAEICSQRNCWLIHDEVYDVFSYTQAPASAQHFKGLRNVISINSLSKKFGVPGLRIGWLVAPPSIIDAAKRVHDHLYLSTCRIGEHLATAILRDTAMKDWLNANRNELKRRTDYFTHAIADISGLSLPGDAVQGGLFAFVNVSGHPVLQSHPSAKSPGQRFANILRDRCKILTVPGDAYGPLGSDYVRFVLAVEWTVLQEAVRRLRDLSSV